MPYYNTEKLTDEIITAYHLDSKMISRKSIQIKVQDICKNIIVCDGQSEKDLWTKSKRLPEGKKKAEHVFNEREKDLIINHIELKKYIIKNLPLNSKELKEQLKIEIKEKAELSKAADELNRQNAEFDNLPNSDGIEFEESTTEYVGYSEYEDYLDLSFYSREDAHQEKMFMMIEALFLKHFTPIDEEILWKDMNAVPLLASTNTNFTPEIMAAIKRYKNKDYYKPLDKNK